jgi:hypothetical protein
MHSMPNAMLGKRQGRRQSQSPVCSLLHNNTPANFALEVMVQSPAMPRISAKSSPNQVLFLSQCSELHPQCSSGDFGAASATSQTLRAHISVRKVQIDTKF